MTEDLHKQATPGLPMQDMGRPGGDGPVATSTMAASGPPPAANPDLTEPTPSPRRSNRWRVAGMAISLLAVAACGWWAWPRAAEGLPAVSTNDAYVDSHVTVVAPRVAGQVARGLVDDNFRVRKGDLLVELDREPYQAQVDLKQAAGGEAEADLRAAESRVRGSLALARGQRWRLQTAIEAVDNQVAALRSQVAALRSKEATQDLARVELGRTEQLMRRNAVSRSELDHATEEFKVAQAQVRQAAEQVREARVTLGLSPDPPEGGSPADVPTDLNQTFSGVRHALAELIQTIAEVGLPLAASEATPSQFLAEFRKLDVQGNVDRIFAKMVPDAPTGKQAQSKPTQARRDPARAELV